MGAWDILLLGVLDWRLAARVAWFKNRNEMNGLLQTIMFIYYLYFPSFHLFGYLLHSSQVMELGTVDLLLQHELLEVLSSIWLPL